MVNQKASEYCQADPYCYASGVYVEYTGGPLSCGSKLYWTWTCYGYNKEDYFPFIVPCRFREIVDRLYGGGVASRPGHHIRIQRLVLLLT